MSMPKTAFLLSVLIGNVNIIKYMALIPEVDIAAQGMNGKNALHYLVNSDNLSHVIYFVDMNKITLSQTDNYKRTLLHYACRKIPH